MVGKVLSNLTILPPMEGFLLNQGMGSPHQRYRGPPDARYACTNNQHFAIYWDCLRSRGFCRINFRHGHRNKINSLRVDSFALVNP